METHRALARAWRPHPVHCPTRQPPPYLPGKRWVAALRTHPQHTYPRISQVHQLQTIILSWWIMHGQLEQVQISEILQIWSPLNHLWSLRVLHIQRNLYSNDTLIWSSLWTLLNGVHCWCGLLLLGSPMFTQSPSLTDPHVLLIFMFIEHILIRAWSESTFSYVTHSSPR